MNNNVFNVSGRVAIVQVWDYRTKRILECFVDIAELPLLQTFDVMWYAAPARSPAGKYYAQAKQWDPAKKQSKTILMHRVLLGVTDPRVEVDHRDNDGLNNRLKNLRPCTHKQNIRFRQPAKDWASHDTALQLVDEYRQERQIGASIAAQFGISRVAMHRIRLDQGVDSPAARAYRKAISDAGVRDLMHLHSAGVGRKPRELTPLRWAA